MQDVVGIRFPVGFKVYHFDPAGFELNPGDKVVVETEQGLAMGEVVHYPARYDAEPDAPPLKKVKRPADEEDLSQLTENAVLEKQAHSLCRDRITARKLDMNLVKVDVFFDRSKIVFYFTAEGRVDFRTLVRDLVGELHTRVEMRQIGVRHEAKLLGGLGSCGRELCCCTFLKDFEPVTIRMAKEQNLPLNPTKLSGLCGRLMCCLGYEYKLYKELSKGLPKEGDTIRLKEGTGRVTAVNVINRSVVVELEGGREVEISYEEGKRER